jgi:cytochrome c-type biogenesis protein CcmH/NrfG
MLKIKVIIFISTFIFSLAAHADLTSDVHALQTNWAKANYELKDETQISAFEALIKQAVATTQKHADAAESWIWLGIIQSTYAGKAGPFDALSYAKAAKKSLKKAIEINATALEGSAYTSLGTLYFKVPGWPLGFGDDDKASLLLEKALELNPEGIDSNYFYADFLIDQDEYKKARQHLLKAKAAPARADRPLADKGRQQEISTLLKKINEELEYNKNEINDEIN